jgi:hypothetical protein
MVAVICIFLGAAPIASEAARAEKAYATYQYKEAIQRLEALLAREDLSDALVRQRGRALGAVF